MKQLKKILLLVVAALLLAELLSGCGKRAETVESEFAELISAEDKITPEALAETADYMTKYLRKLSEEKAGIMLLSYEAYAAQYINTDSDQNQVQSLLTFFDADAGEIDERKLKKDENAADYYDTLTRSYIKVYLEEEKITLKLDYAAMADEFEKEIPKAVSELYILKGVINKQPASTNATLQISYQALLGRAYSVERIMTEYGGQEVVRELLQEDCKWLYSTYLNMIFMGTTNSPVFDYDTGVFSEEARLAYEEFMKQQPDSALAWAMGEYFNYLETIGYTMDYKDSDMSKTFFDNCSRIVSETEKRVKE